MEPKSYGCLSWSGRGYCGGATGGTTTTHDDVIGFRFFDLCIVAHSYPGAEFGLIGRGMWRIVIKDPPMPESNQPENTGKWKKSACALPLEILPSHPGRTFSPRVEIQVPGRLLRSSSMISSVGSSGRNKFRAKPTARSHERSANPIAPPCPPTPNDAVVSPMILSGSPSR